MGWIQRDFVGVMKGEMGGNLKFAILVLVLLGKLKSGNEICQDGLSLVCRKAAG